MSAGDPAVWFDADGPLARHIPGYAPRAVQRVMAERVASALADGRRLLIEAGTGTGKTLAYLLPALASGRKVIVATATRHLQDQIYRKDVPQVRSALDKPLRVAMLKGRANYLCLHRLNLTEQSGRIRDPAQYAQLRAIRQWAGRTRTGDVNEIGDAGDGSPLWPRVTSTADNCLGTDCPEFGRCWVVEARRAAQAADLVIANHHLLFADMALREEGFGEVLPGADAVILDEAHKLPEIAGRFFGRALSGRQVRDLVRDGHAEAGEAGGDMPALTATLDETENAESAFAAAVGGLPGSTAWEAVLESPDATAAMTRLGIALGALAENGKAVAERSEGLAHVARRAVELGKRLGQLQTDDGDSVRWLERRGVGWILHATPLDIAPQFSRAVAAHEGAWILTSATLSVDGRLDYFARRLGLEDAEQLILDSPFDYRHNGLLYLPPGLPDPRRPGFEDAVADAALPLIRASGGGAFLLCTSHRALQRCAQRLAASGVSPLLVQGDMGRGELLEAFRRRPDAVLVGTSSFWEGVDVRGRGLRLVIIDRLPFASPGDPVLQARMRAMRERGEEPFIGYQLPQAVIALKQGVGRLIRDADDRGVLAICDPRLRSRGYGRVFLKSLPPMPVTDDTAAVKRFLESLAAA